MTNRFDVWLQKFPGGPGVKVFAGVSLILLFTGRNTVFASSGGKQGEHYFSQERPEAIAQAQERQQKEYMEQQRHKNNNKARQQQE